MKIVLTYVAFILLLKVIGGIVVGGYNLGDETYLQTPCVESYYYHESHYCYSPEEFYE